MRTVLLALLIAAFGGDTLSAQAATAPAAAERVALDAAVLERVAELAERDLPRKLLERMLHTDIELLRGPRPNGTYEWATWERFEAGRISDSFSVQPKSDEMKTIEMSGEYVYRVLLDVPERRLMVRPNRPVWVERIDFQYVATAGRTERGSIPVKEWVQPGTVRPVDLPGVARQAVVQVIATADPAAGYGNVTISLLQARIIDLASSPWAAAVEAAKAALRALEQNDVAAVRTAALRMKKALPGPGTSPDAASALELQTELQVIEDLLGGTEVQKQDGLSRLRALGRRLRP